jgi:hypothetical protein
VVVPAVQTMEVAYCAPTKKQLTQSVPRRTFEEINTYKSQLQLQFDLKKSVFTIPFI